jgi:hypothetical protein
MGARLYQVDLPPEILSRGFWLYVWNIVGPCRERFCYVGMTGDGPSRVAQSPYVRAGAHLGFNKNNNGLRKHLAKKGVVPEKCRSLAFLAYGPMLPYRHKDPTDGYEASRKRVGALERQLWTAAEAAGNTMLNQRPRFPEEFDELLWKDVHAAFTPHLKLSN